MKSLNLILLLLVALPSLAMGFPVSNDRTLKADNIVAPRTDYVTLKSPLELEFEAMFKEIATPSNPASGFQKLYAKTDGKFYKLDFNGVEKLVGLELTSTNDNRLIKSDGVAAEALQETGISIDDLNNMTGINDLTVDGSLIGVGAVPLDGADTQLLTWNTGTYSWEDAPVSTTLDTQGQIQGYSTENAPIGPCTDDQILLYDSLEATGWKCSPLPSTSPTTTEGDLVVRGATEDERLPIGTVNQLLTSDGTTASWQDAPVSTTLTSKGELQGHDGVSNVSIPPGVDGSFPVYDSTQPSGIGSSTSIQGKLNPVTNWESFTVTGSWTNTTYTGFYRQVGDSAEFHVTAEVTGAVGSLELYIDISEVGLVDATKLSSTNTAYSIVGAVSANGLNGGGTSDGFATFDGNFPTRIQPYAERISSNDDVVQMSVAVFDNIGAGDEVVLKFSVPIQGFSSGLDSVAQNSLSPDYAGFVSFSFMSGEMIGHKAADGACYKKADYPDYMKRVGTLYGECTIDVANDGFNVPDMRGYFPRVLDNMGTLAGAAGVDVDGTARSVGVLQSDENKSHDHGVFTAINAGQGYALNSQPGNNQIGNINHQGAQDTLSRTDFQGGSETRPKNMALMAYVRMVDNNVIVGTFEQIESVDTELTLETANVLTAKISNTGTILEDDLGFLDSCSFVSTGRLTCNFTSGAFNVPPNIVGCVPADAASTTQEGCEVTGAITTSEIKLELTRASASSLILFNNQVSFTVAKQGSDVNKSIKGAIIKASDEFAQIESVDGTLTLETANDFSASFDFITSNGSHPINSESFTGAITCNRTSLGASGCTISGANLTEVPVVHCTVSQDESGSGNRNCTVRNKTTTSFTVNVLDTDSTLEDSDFDITVFKQGADANKDLKGVVINLSTVQGLTFTPETSGANVAKICSWNANTGSTAGPFNEIGDCMTNTGNVDTGNASIRFNFEPGYWASKPNCTCNVEATSAGDRDCNSSANVNTIDVATAGNNSPANYNVTMICHGVGAP